MTGKFERILRTATKHKPEDNRQNMIAIVEKGGNIISVGSNNMECTHPVYFNGEHDKCVHAEFNALRQIKHTGDYGRKYNKVADGCNMYVFYFKRSGGLGDSKPCEHCYDEIKKSGINRIYYIKEGTLIK
jgi:deoxycytidylate deaminase